MQTSTEAISLDQSWDESEVWRWWRRQMPVCSTLAYFDNAAVAPISGPAAIAMTRYVEEAATLGDTVWPSWNANGHAVRSAAASLVHCEPSEIAIVANTTAGICTVAEGLTWRAGDNVIIPDGEFPSNLFPWMHLAERYGVELKVVPRRGDRVLVSDLIDAIDSRTRLIALSWVGYASGYRVDIDSIVQQAHRQGVLVFLDAIQGLGLYDLDVRKTPVDFLSADGHKWLLGPEGAGVLMVRGEHIASIRPSAVGWASVKAPHNYAKPEFQLRDDAVRFEYGSANMAGVAGLQASLSMFVAVRERLGDDAIENRILDLVECLKEKLSSIGATTRMHADRGHRSGIVNFTVPGEDPSAIRARGLQQGVVLSVRDGGVRAAVHVYNNAEDLQRLIDVVQG